MARAALRVDPGAAQAVLPARLRPGLHAQRVSVPRVLEGEQDNLVLEVEVVELVDQRSRLTGRGAAVEEAGSIASPASSAVRTQVRRLLGTALADTEVLLEPGPCLDPNLTDPFVRLVRKERELTRESRAIVFEDRQALPDRKNNNRVTH
jgi:hypothetical protein